MKIEMKKNILIVTPMLPPTPGGPAIHAKKLAEHFSGEVFNFEKLNKFPFGIRQLVALFLLLPKFLKAEIIFALDGFSVAIPSVILGKILKKKVILRIGGDFVHEQYVASNPLPLDEFYEGLKNKKINLSEVLKIKFFFQKFVVENCYGIVFNSSWQKNIYENFYNLPKKTWVVLNPVEVDTAQLLSEKSSGNTENVLGEGGDLVFLSAGRNTPIKNLERVKQAFAEAQKETDKTLLLDTQVTSQEMLFERMKSARALICASISEVSPNTVSDALSLGLPTILTQNSGYKDFLQDKAVVRFVDPRNVEDIKKAILEMCDNQKYLEYRNNLQNFVWPQTWDKLFTEYESILNSIL